MSTSVELSRIERVEIGPADTILIVAKGSDGKDVKISMPSRTSGYLGGPLLCATAMSLAAPPRPGPGTAVSGYHLPVLDWEVGRGRGGPILVLKLPGRIALQFQLNPATAHASGQALMQHAR